jgi:hypothetical protein
MSYVLSDVRKILDSILTFAQSLLSIVWSSMQFLVFECYNRIRVGNIEDIFSHRESDDSLGKCVLICLNYFEHGGSSMNRMYVYWLTLMVNLT